MGVKKVIGKRKGLFQMRCFLQENKTKHLIMQDGKNTGDTLTDADRKKKEILSD